MLNLSLLQFSIFKPNKISLDPNNAKNKY